MVLLSRKKRGFKRLGMRVQPTNVKFYVLWGCLEEILRSYLETSLVVRSQS